MRGNKEAKKMNMKKLENPGLCLVIGSVSRKGMKKIIPAEKMIATGPQLSAKPDHIKYKLKAG
jgi:hypothetical protein